MTTFVNRLIMLSPIMQYIPPMSFVHKKFLKKLQTVVGKLYCYSVLIYVFMLKMRFRLQAKTIFLQLTVDQ